MRTYSPLFFQESWIKGIPPLNLIIMHQKMYPIIDKFGSYTKFMGGAWLVKTNAGSSTFILTAKNNTIVLWNGISFTQPLDECRWAHNAYYMPAKGILEK